MRDIIGHGGGKGGGSSHTHYEAPDSLHSTSYARVLDLVSEGEILGLAEGLQSVYLDDTPIQNADGSNNFQGVTVDFRTGTQAQDYIPGFPDVESETTVGFQLKYGTPWVRAIGNTALSAVRITLGIDQLYKANTDNGDVGGSSVSYKIELSTDGGAYQTVISSAFTGKTMNAYQRSTRIDLPPATTGWQLRVSRLTPDSTVVSVVDKTNIISFTEVIDAKLRYPMSAIVGIQVDAKQFQSIPTRAYDLFGRIIQVPSNYNPRTRAYSGAWDGTFKPSWSDNPAWVFRDLALNDRYGLGHRITAAQLDKWALYKIARYCDEMVPNGKGGTEPRFTCNLYLQTRKQAYAVLQDIASIFRGISYWGAGTIMASADMPSDPVYVYTAANVIGGKFTRTGTKKSTRYTVALVTWNDPDDSGKPKVEYVEDPEGIARYGIQQTELTAFGCTSQGQAHRAGRWALATSRLETEGISFDVGLDGAIALPGQVVRIADPSRMGRRVGGRVRAVAGRVITLDKAPTVKPGDHLTVILPSGTSETRMVVSVAGDAVTVDSDWSTAPRVQSVWSVDSTELSAPLFRVLSVTEKDEVTFTITAVQHELGKYAFVENGTPITPRTQTALDVTTQAPPTSVTLAGYTVSLADVQKLALQVSCAPVVGAVAYEGAYRRGDDNWVAIPRQPSPTMDVLDVLAGTYMAKMAAVNSIGVTSIETLSVAVEIARDGASKNADILLSSDAPSFYTNQAGTTAPSVITISATLIALDGPVTWSCVGGTLTNKAATTAQLAFADAPASSATVTATITAFGRTYTKSLKIGKVQDGAAGADGLKTAAARLYQWGATTPSKPTGSSTFTWASLSNSAYNGTDAWTVTVPANPGTPGLRLYVASAPVSAAANATTTTVSYTSATVEAWSQNGANGASGVQSASPTVYQWAATIPAGPAGSASLKWADSSFGAAPSGWTLAPGAAPSAGMTLWAARVQVTDTAASSTTTFQWSTAAVMAIGYVGTDGTAAAYVEVSNNGQVFSRATSAAAFAPTSITLTATPYGGAATYQWQYWTGSAWTNISGATAATYAVASGAFTDARTFRVQATIGGAIYVDEVTLVQVTGGTNGANAITGFLTNESVTLAATSAGAVPSFSTATGAFKVFDGVTDKTGASVTYSVAAQTGCTVAINAAGVYSASAMSADQATATLQAVYAGVTIQKTLSLAKAKAGEGGTPGVTGASYVTAYCASVTGTATSAPAGTTGKTSLPATNSGGIVGTWSATVPDLTAGQYLYQSDGIYDPTTNSVTWSKPYWSSLKVATLSAITANLGAINAGSINLGAGVFTVDNAGNLVCSSITIKRADGTVILTSNGLTAAGAAPGTVNADLVPSITTAGTTANSDSMIRTPQGGYFNGGNGLVGAIKVKLPRSWTNTMMKFTVDIFEYDAGYTCTLDIAGYNYDGEGGPAKWFNVTARVSGNSNVEYPVRFGHDGGTCCVWIGEPTEVWKYPKVFVRDFLAGHNNTTAAMWSSGWAVSMDTAAAANVSATVLDTYPAADWTKIPNKNGKPADNATVGAPPGTSVGGTEAGLLASRALNGDSAYNAIPGINSTISTKLNKAGSDTISGQISLQSQYALLVGTSNDGIFYGSTGIYGRKGGVTTFGIGADGTAVFSGQLIAAAGTLGSVHIPGGGGVHGGSFTDYGWPGQVNGAWGTGFYVGPEGALWGNPGTGMFIQIYSSGRLVMPGFDHNFGQLTLTNPVIVTPNIQNPNFGTFTVTMQTGWDMGGSGKVIQMGTRTATITGGTDPKSIRWALENSGDATISIVNGQGTASVTLRSNVGQVPATGNATLTCTVTAANGLVATTSINVSSNHM